MVQLISLRAAYGILSAGSDNKINFAGDVTIASYSLGNPVDKKRGAKF